MQMAAVGPVIPTLRFRPTAERRSQGRLKPELQTRNRLKAELQTGGIPTSMTAHLHIDGATVAAPLGVSVFDCAEQVDVHVPTSCHKQGKCRECLVEVVTGMKLLSERTSEEDSLADGFRLSCRARVVGELGDIRCHTMRRSEIRVEEGGVSVAARLDPAVTRRGDTVFLDGREIATWQGPLHGLAADIGTTTVVLRLVDLEHGSVVAAQSFENPQRFGGSDVMARITYDSNHPGRLLQRTLLGYLRRAIEDFHVPADSIFEMVVVGNSTMRDLLFGLDVESIGQRPYRSIVEHEFRAGERETTSVSVAPKRLRLPMHANGRICSLPLVSGHVGADAAACLLAVGMQDEQRQVALMDVGTNTEFFIGNRDRLFAASCPAGPAFEGGLVSCGMPGLEGAIERVALTGDRVEVNVIGGVEPTGVCGSGLVDLLSELLRTGQMNSLGRYTDDAESYVIDSERSISLSEQDISNLAQAKAANIAGLRIVMSRAGLRLDDIEVFYLAGGFARHLDIDAARRIGFIPDLPDDKIRLIGNAAIEGATTALLSSSQRDEFERFIRGIEHVELETDERFFDYFVDGCQFIRVRDEGGADGLA